VKTKDRLTNESAFHNRQARRRIGTFEERPDRFQFDEEAYLNHESWVRPAFERLGDLRGLRVLDLGCGHGMASVIFARRGARVTGMDLSWGYLSEARQRARANSVPIHYVQANGECLPFADASFDRVWGNAILHHLDLHLAGAELFRILAPGGTAIFAEPWGENPLLNWARKRLPYPGKERTPDEEPLRRKHVRILQTVFPLVEMRGYQLLSMARRVFRQSPWMAGLDAWDRMLLARVPRLEQFCRYVILTLRK
jgi:ubiquinone/menaquinone biosynthesis C-methylase UbiE